MKLTRKAFTLIELLVVIAIISLLLSILLPTLSLARRKVRNVVCLKNVGSLSEAEIAYALDHNGHFRRSVAIMEWFGYTSSPIPPTYYVSPWTPDTSRNSRNNSVATNLHDYVDDPDIFGCPFTQAPPYWPLAWQMQENYQNPEISHAPSDTTNDSLTGPYNLLAGYPAYIDSNRMFQGPTKLGERNSKLLVTDYLGFTNQHFTEGSGSKLDYPWVYVSSHPFRNSGHNQKHAVYCDYLYSMEKQYLEDVSDLQASPSAALTDGSAFTFTPDEQIKIKVLKYGSNCYNSSYQFHPRYGDIFIPFR